MILKYFLAFAFLNFSKILIGAEDPEVVKCGAVLPQDRGAVRGIYDGDDSIFIFGGYRNLPGYSFEYTDQILRYSLSNDSIEEVGKFPVPIDSGAVVKDSDGNIFYFGGFVPFNSKIPSGPVNSIYKFSPGDLTMELVGQLPCSVARATAFQYNDTTAFIFGGEGSPSSGKCVMSFNVKTYESNRLADLPASFPEAHNIWDPNNFDGRATIFGKSCSVDNCKSALFDPHSGLSWLVGFPNFPNVFRTSTSFITGKNGYLIGGNKPFVFVQINLITRNWSFREVKNPMPSYYDGAAVFVPKLNRVYLFGGVVRENYVNDIWYIDIFSLENPGIPVTTTTEISTESTTTTERPPFTTKFPELLTQSTTTTEIPTTPSPGMIFCSNQTDGVYIHPESCRDFRVCLDGDVIYYSCPGDLLFDPELRACNVPNLVNCRLTCVNRPDGIFPHPYDCGLFVVCRNQNIEIFSCPQDPLPLRFDRIGLRCNLPNLAQC